MGTQGAPCAPNMVQFWPVFTDLRHFEKIGANHFSLIGRHLESVGRTEPVFDLNLAPSEERPTYEFRPMHFLLSYRVNVISCNLCARAKVKGHRELKIEKTLPSENWSSRLKFGSCTSFRFMGYGRQKWYSFLQQLAAILAAISAQFHYMPESYIRVRVGWHCAMVKGHAKLKP